MSLSNGVDDDVTTYPNHDIDLPIAQERWFVQSDADGDSGEST